jgi:hypothetical protein
MYPGRRRICLLDRLAGSIKGGLRDVVVYLEELELDHVAQGGGDI